MDFSNIALRLMVRVDDGIAFLASLGGRLQRVWDWLFSILHWVLARDSSDNIGAWIGRSWTLLWLPSTLIVDAGAGLFQVISQRARENFVFNHLVVRPIAELLIFLSTLYFTRPYQLRLGIPVAVLAVLLMGLGVGSFNLFDTSNISQRYVAEIDRALSNNQFDRVQLFQDKLAQMGLQAQPLQLKNIKAMADQGNMEQAIAWAEGIAPLDKPGVAAAHFWLAIHYLNDESESASNSALTAERHLEHVMAQCVSSGKESGVPTEIEYLLATSKLKSNRVVEGLAQLETACRDYWPATVLCLELNQALRRQQGLMNAAERLLIQAKKQPEILNQFNSDCFALWATALRSAHGSENWMEVAELWHSRFPCDERCLAIWTPLQFDRIEIMIRNLELKRVADTLNAIGRSPGGDSRKLLSDWIFSKSQSADSRRFMDSLIVYLLDADDSSDTSGVLLEILGTAAIVRGNEELAIQLLKKGLQVEPRNAIAWNNLAFLTSKNTPDKIEDALSAANRAVDLDSQNVNIRLTRGMLAIASKQWRLAANDLEFVSQFRPDDGAIHQSLAIAFGHLGNRDKASLHQLLAGE